MEIYGQWTKVFDHLKKGEITALLKLKQETASSANDDVVLGWNFTYNDKNGQLMSLFNITPKSTESYVSCTLTTLMDGETVLASGLSSLSSNLKAETEAPYNGWLWRHYVPGKPTTIKAEIMGTLTAPNGIASQFNFNKSIQVG